MIPYDDLVSALAAWRARKGLSVATTGTQSAAATAPAATTPAPRARSTPPAAPQPRAASPQPQSASPSRQQPVAAPPPLATPDELDVDEAAMLEEQYENEGADFAMNFGDNATAVGGPPQRDSVTTDPVGAPAAPRRGRRDEEW